MESVEIEHRAALARQQLSSAQAQLQWSDDDLEQMRLRDMVRVWGAIAEGLDDARDEAGVRGTISALAALMGRSLDAAAFMIAIRVTEDLRNLLGDSYVDEGLVPRSSEEASAFLASALTDEEKEVIRTHLFGENVDSMAAWRIGMAVRNRLRSAGFSEESLGVENLDNVWRELLERAMNQ